MSFSEISPLLLTPCSCTLSAEVVSLRARASVVVVTAALLEKRSLVVLPRK